MSRLRMLTVAVCAAALLCPAAALAQYPPPDDPGKKVERPRGKPATLRVCKQKKSDCFRTIGAAVKKARAGDRILVSNGTYREGVQIVGRAKSRIKLLGNRKRPGRVLLEGKGLSGPRAQNGVIINGANGVTVAGFKAKNYKGNGFFAVNVTGYLLTDLIAERTGAYGVYAFNSKGGKMTDSEAYFNNDSGFYVGQTPPQARPKRTIVRNVDSWGNVIGFSGTNMRYTTITKSRWFNNGLGIVPNSLDSEKFAPPADNVIIDNDIFWNNFNYYAGAPFELREESAGLSAYPVGTGVLLFGGQRHRIEDNRIYGNWLTGAGAIQQILQGDPTPQDPNSERGVLKGNEVVGNDFGLGGADLNGRDMFYDGSGSGNCFANNTVRSVQPPGEQLHLRVLPVHGREHLRRDRPGHRAGLGGGPDPLGPRLLRAILAAQRPQGQEGHQALHPLHRERALQEGARAGLGERGQDQGGEGGRLLLHPEAAAGQAGRQGHLALAQRRGRPARREGHQGPGGREEVPVRPGGVGLQLQPPAEEAGGLQDHLHPPPRQHAAADQGGALRGHRYP